MKERYQRIETQREGGGRGNEGNTKIRVGRHLIMILFDDENYIILEEMS